MKEVLRVAARGVKMIIPSELQFTAERLNEISRQNWNS